jgi:hypothetical protein
MTTVKTTAKAIVPRDGIQPSGSLSFLFLQKGIHTFQQATEYIRGLPFKRNTDKSDPLCVLNDGFGTCGTKHATLRRLAEEQGLMDVDLVIGIFKMSAHNMPELTGLLEKESLPYIPEAHCYLRIKGKILDCMNTSFNIGEYEEEIIVERIISPEQITDLKVQFHQAFLKNWKQVCQIEQTFEEIWALREKCIRYLEASHSTF